MGLTGHQQILLGYEGEFRLDPSNCKGSDVLVDVPRREEKYRNVLTGLLEEVGQDLDDHLEMGC